MLPHTFISLQTEFYLIFLLQRNSQNLFFEHCLELYRNHRFSITLKEHSKHNTHRETNVILWLCWGNNPITNLSEFWWRLLFLKLKCVIVCSLFWWLMVFIYFCTQALYIHSSIHILPFISSSYSSCYPFTHFVLIFFYLIFSSLKSLFSLWHFICVGSFSFAVMLHFKLFVTDKNNNKKTTTKNININSTFLPFMVCVCVCPVQSARSVNNELFSQSGGWSFSAWLPTAALKKLTSFSAWMDGWAEKLADRHTDYNLDEINF